MVVAEVDKNALVTVVAGTDGAIVDDVMFSVVAICLAALFAAAAA